ncbi:hypothetical protein LEMA_P067700.1 [Plenodomus lingam JN3]|uniref:60S ribosomal protein L23 n=1 Tax=Leptosphaeria maculans (strain JN3 / isolate v23.1.3 / race Av1-4-5-6-7-8) TaxID=985895 RepID=E4ZIZ2_LEPMJ|nr:hypothetical protein LEMA_P067700.1 [Plenodomus lingam JN3]CBX91262.1 hypothetical protein LEMA_P067700.1 [Plenodomus lingam JN3]
MPQTPHPRFLLVTYNTDIEAGCAIPMYQPRHVAWAVPIPEGEKDNIWRLVTAATQPWALVRLESRPLRTWSCLRLVLLTRDDGKHASAITSDLGQPRVRCAFSIALPLTDALCVVFSFSENTSNNPAHAVGKVSLRYFVKDPMYSGRPPIPLQVRILRCSSINTFTHISSQEAPTHADDARPQSSIENNIWHWVNRRLKVRLCRVPVEAAALLVRQVNELRYVYAISMHWSTKTIHEQDAHEQDTVLATKISLPVPPSSIHLRISDKSVVSFASRNSASPTKSLRNFRPIPSPATTTPHPPKQPPIIIRHVWKARGSTSGNKLKMTLGLPVGAVMNCCDNSGARNLYIISVKGIGARLNRLPAGGAGDMVMATVKKGKPELRKKVMPAVIVRQSKPWRRADGVFLYFEDNAGVIVNPKGEMKGSAITGPVAKEAAELWPRIASNSGVVM